MAQNLASNKAEKLNDSSVTSVVVPKLSVDKETILEELAMADVQGDRQADSVSDKNMLEWTLNEIRKTCGNLPPAKLKTLTINIKKVIEERGIYKEKIKIELKKEREKLKKEVDNEMKEPTTDEDTSSGKKATGMDKFLKVIQEHTDFRLFSKIKFETIGEIPKSKRDILEHTIEQNNELLSKFLDGWQNDHRWRKNLAKKHPESFVILQKMSQDLIKKYNIQIENIEGLSEIQKKVKLAKSISEGQNRDKQENSKYTNSIGEQQLKPLFSKISLILSDESTINPTQIQELATESRKTVANVRNSYEYKELTAYVEKTNDPLLKNKLHILNQNLIKLDTTATKISKASFLTTMFVAKGKNMLTEMKNKLEAAYTGIIKGEILIESFNQKEGNTVKSIEVFEKEIQEKIAIGGAQNVNAKGFSDYLIVLSASNKLNLAYLKEKGFLSQFGLHWKINANESNNTRTQELLNATPEGKKALSEFKSVIKQQLEYLSSKEAIDKGDTFQAVKIYLEKQKVDQKDIQDSLEMLKKTGGNGIEELITIASQMGKGQKQNPANMSDLAKGMKSDYAKIAQVASVELNGAEKKSISEFLSHLKGTKLKDNLDRDLLKAMYKKQLETGCFTVNDMSFDNLITQPDIYDNILAVFEKNYTQTDMDTNDQKKIGNMIKYLKAHRPAETMKEVAKDLHTQKTVEKLAKKIGAKATSLPDAQKRVKEDKEVKKLSKDIDQIVAIEKASKNIEDTLDHHEQSMTPATLEKIMKLIGMNASGITKKLLLQDITKAFEFLNHIHSYSDDFLSSSLSEDEYIQLRIFEAQLAEFVSKELVIAEKHGELGTFMSNNSLSELENNTDSKLGFSQISQEVYYANNSYKQLQEHSYYTSSGLLDVQSIRSQPTGTPFQIDRQTIFTLGTNGSCSIITPYSIEIIPPEKTNIALGFISAARLFPGIDLMGGLHETLQSYTANPILAKMKDGVTKREACELIKHYAMVLGISGYDMNAETPDVLIRSIKNSLPLGTSFWELANNRGLLRNDGTINPIALGKTFQVPARGDDSKQIENIPQNHEVFARV